MPDRGRSERKPAPPVWELSWPLSLGEVMDWCILTHGVDRLLAVTEYRDRMSQAAMIEALFGDRVIAVIRATAWPGTIRARTPGRVHVVDFDRDLAVRMSSIEDDASRWIHIRQPPLPEDLCLYKDGNAWPTLFTVTHEADAYLISKNGGEFRGSAPPRFWESEEVGEHIPDRPYFCRGRIEVERGA
jgi:hypothetical protein